MAAVGGSSTKHASIPFYEDEPVKKLLKDGRTVTPIKTIRYVEDVLTFYHETDPSSAAKIGGSRAMRSGSDGTMGGGIYLVRDKADTEYKAHRRGIYLRCQVAPGRLGVMTDDLIGNVSRENCVAAGLNGLYGPADVAHPGKKEPPFPFSKDEWVVFDESRTTMRLIAVENDDGKLKYEELPEWIQKLYDTEGSVVVDNGLYKETWSTEPQACRHGIVGAPCLYCDLERGMPGFGGDDDGEVKVVKVPKTVFVRGYNGRDKEAGSPALPDAPWSPVPGK